MFPKCFVALFENVRTFFFYTFVSINLHLKLLLCVTVVNPGGVGATAPPNIGDSPLNFVSLI